MACGHHIVACAAPLSRFTGSSPPLLLNHSNRNLVSTTKNQTYSTPRSPTEAFGLVSSTQLLTQLNSNFLSRNANSVQKFALRVMHDMSSGQTGHTRVQRFVVVCVCVWWWCVCECVWWWRRTVTRLDSEWSVFWGFPNFPFLLDMFLPQGLFFECFITSCLLCFWLLPSLESRGCCVASLQMSPPRLLLPGLMRRRHIDIPYMRGVEGKYRQE